MRSSGSMRKLGPRFRDVLLKPCHRALSDRHVAVFLAFALAHHDQPAVELQIEQFQIHDFQPAQSAGVDHFQDRAIAQAQRIGEIRLQHHLLDLRHGEDVLRQRAAQAWQIDLRCRVVQDVVLPRHPAKPHAQRNQPRVLAAERQRLAVLFAVEEQVPLIAFEHRARDLVRFSAGHARKPTG